jgi:D-aminoacyl-tRNA deacylase
MKIVLQRVKYCRVSINGHVAGAIEKGLLILLGVDKKDTPAQADFLAEKCAALRIFGDDQGKMNVSLVEAGGEALVVSQFTLLGDCTKGRRPNFTEAAPPEMGKELYERFVKKLKALVPRVETGIFGAMMDVELLNDGPVTLVLEK